MIKVDKLSLLNGNHFVASNGLVVKHPKITDILVVGDLEYAMFVSLFCASPADYMVLLYSMKIDYYEVTNYQLFFMLLNINDKILKNCLKVFLNMDEIEIITNASDGSQLLSGKVRETKYDITEDIYNEICEFMTIINCYSSNVERKFANESTRKAWFEVEMEDMEDRENSNKDGFANLVSAVVGKNNCGINYLNIWDLYIYQFQDLTRRLMLIEEYSNLMYGIYSGNIDSSKMNLNKVSWINPINN